MLTRLLSQRENNTFGLVSIGILILSLFVGGVILGRIANTMLDSVPSTGNTDATRPTSGALVDPPHLLQDFTLTSHTGDPLSLSDLRGQAVLLFFGYTHCPDVCPTTLADYRRVKDSLSDQSDEMAFVFISVDGTRDTPEVLAQYLNQFDPDFIGLTADEATLRRMGAEYGLIFEHQRIDVGHEHPDDHEHEPELDDENYFVQHTSPSFLVDRDGYLRQLFFYGTESDVIAAGVRQILE